MIPTAIEALARAAAGELLGPADLRVILGVGPTQFYARKKRGEFDRFLVRNPIGARCYSGTLVHRYVTGEPVYEPTFGARRGAR